MNCTALSWSSWCVLSRSSSVDRLSTCSEDALGEWRSRQIASTAMPMEIEIRQRTKIELRAGDECCITFRSAPIKGPTDPICLWAEYRIGGDWIGLYSCWPSLIVLYAVCSYLAVLMQCLQQSSDKLKWLKRFVDTGQHRCIKRLYVLLNFWVTKPLK